MAVPDQQGACGTARATLAGYCADGPRMMFTGQQRDAETGLDYFGARYMASAQGRFTSLDAPLLDQQPGDPQSWNLYSYVRNNPLIFTDPTGNDCVYVTSGGNGIDSINNQSTLKDCGKTGGYWVDGTVTNARFAYGSLILTGTTNGQDRTSASFGLGPDPGLMALQRGTQLAEPGVNLAGEGLKLFGYAVNAPAMALIECAAKGKDCSPASTAMAMIPGGAGEATAAQIIARSRAGSVLREFPGQYLNSTLKEIQRDAKQGVAAARKALKLLKDTRDKFTK